MAYDIKKNRPSVPKYFTGNQMNFHPSNCIPFLTAKGDESRLRTKMRRSTMNKNIRNDKSNSFSEKITLAGSVYSAILYLHMRSFVY